MEQLLSQVHSPGETSYEDKTKSICVISDDDKCYNEHKTRIEGRTRFLWRAAYSGKSFEGDRIPVETYK